MRKDNTTFRRKVSLRLKALGEVASPVVMETHGGKGLIFNRCYFDLPRGVVFENDEDKSVILARQRPTWAVWEGDCNAAIAAGVGFHYRPNFFDLDPYGSPWLTVEAICSQADRLPDKLALVVNDGLKKKLQIGGGWQVKCLREWAQRIGNDALCERYLDVCRQMVSQRFAAAGFALAKFEGYYCGHHQSMTHYLAVLVRGTPG